MNKRNIGVFVAGCLMVLGATSAAYADHSWGAYHWARGANPFTVKLGDNVSGVWDGVLATASTDWTASSVLDTTIVAGGTVRNPKACKATPGRGEVCNAKYGFNGWLGIASIWATGEHITQGTVKLNDTYFNTSSYNTVPWRNLVMCQEVGHIFGLDHQDEAFGNPNLDTCMDYTNSPVSNQHPNAHDYAMLETIYAHLDGAASAPTQSVSGVPQDIGDDPREWGREIKKSKDGRVSLFMRDFGNGKKAFTHVFWVPERNAQ
ncbi:MAG: hypothetical protein AAB421_02545 [Patescibacteria group bacterium]